MPFEQRCAFACQPGFRMDGPSLRECILPGIWTGGTVSTRCIGMITKITFFLTLNKNCVQGLTFLTLHTSNSLIYACLEVIHMFNDFVLNVDSGKFEKRIGQRIEANTYYVKKQ